MNDEITAALAHFDSFTPTEGVPSHGQTDADRKAGRFSYAENIAHGQALAKAYRERTGKLVNIGFHHTTCFECGHDLTVICTACNPPAQVAAMRELDRTLCNYLNDKCDPYDDDPSAYAASLARHFKELLDAYDAAHKAGVFKR